MVEKIEDMFAGFDRIHERDGRTDRRTDRHRQKALKRMANNNMFVRGQEEKYPPLRARLCHGPAQTLWPASSCSLQFPPH